MKKTIIEAILGTDMSFHNQSLAKLKEKTPLYQQESLPESEKNVMNVLTQFLLSFFVHTADLNNTILETGNYLNWARLIAQEFQSIAQAEAHFGLPVTQMLVYKDEVGFYNSQKGFSGILR